VEENLADICASIQSRIVSILLDKLKKAAYQTGIKELCIAGGVSANSGLRSAFEKMGKEEGWSTYIPKFEYCTDNAAMIAITAYYKYMNSEFENLSVVPSARTA
jgi:N6-L-threonylcarbamoyladenine synthase